MLLNLFRRKHKSTECDIVLKNPAKRLSEYLKKTDDINEYFTLPEGNSIKKDSTSEGLLVFYEINRNGENAYYCRLEFENYNFKGNVLYIWDLYRIDNVEYVSHTGSKILDGIAKIAEAFDFEYVVTNPKASMITANALSQDELEEWYHRHLSGKSFHYQEIQSDDDLYTL